MLKKKWMSSLIIILVFALVACAYDTPLDDNTNNNKPMGVAYENIKLSPEEVFNTFMDRHSQAKVNKVGLEFDDGSYVYEVGGYDDTKEYEIKINPIDGSILKEEQDNRDNKGEITLEDVSEIQGFIDRTLEDEGKNYRIKEWTLKIKNGETLFEIEVINSENNDIEYKYNVNTGELIEKD